MTGPLRNLFAFALASFGIASAQSSQPPIFFINGYQFSCLLSGGISGTFGGWPQLLSAAGIASGGYDTCSCRGCNIEQHAAALGQALASFRTPGGAVPAQIDVVAHSMGGLILRAYLAGKTGGASSPPLTPAIRKAVFVATPNFGLIAPAIDNELTQMQLGSRFLWELGTWNQNTDDLRGIDAIAIAGSGGSSGRPVPDDGLVPVSSAAISFVADPERTRVLPYCHSNPIPVIIQCRADAPPIGKIDSLNHPVFRIVQSFFSDTNDWKSIGTSVPNGGLYLAYRDAADKLVTQQSVTLGSTAMSTRDNQVFYREWIAPGTYTASGGVQVTVPAGGIRPLVAKSGTSIARVYPSAAALPYLSVAPGSLISIYGTNLGSATVLLNNSALTTSYNSSQQINAVLPAGMTGLQNLTVRNSQGEHTVSLMIEPAAPALFTLNGSGAGPAAAIDAVTGEVITGSKTASPGSYVSLFATGLGEVNRSGGLDFAVQQPVVGLSSRTVPVLFAGRAPGFPGLDQINIQIPAGLAPGDYAVQIRSGRRTSNTVTLTIR